MKRTVQILLVEDDRGDVILTKKMFEHVRVGSAVERR